MRGQAGELQRLADHLVQPGFANLPLGDVDGQAQVGRGRNGAPPVGDLAAGLFQHAAAQRQHQTDLRRLALHRSPPPYAE